MTTQHTSNFPDEETCNEMEMIVGYERERTDADVRLLIADTIVKQRRKLAEQATEIERLKEENAEMIALIADALPDLERAATREKRANSAPTGMPSIHSCQERWKWACAILAKYEKGG